ncbi:MAG TPA: hypothetical protein VI457_13870 [Methylococcaceae bacterium]|nr:hypothetical protein [Methylococcaceae bacterium]
MSRDGVKHLIGRLANHQPLVSHAYYSGELIKDEDNARGIELLQQHKVLIPRGEDAYTLHTTLRRFLDAALNIERLYGIGSDLGVAFERMEQLTDALFDAAHEGRAEDRERLEDEIRQSIYEISDNLAADLAHLRTLVENRFAAVSTLAEKKRQNGYYIGRTEKVVRAIELFTLSDLGERIQTQGAFANIAVMFRAQLQERLPSFRQNLSDILEILKHYLFEFREIEDRTRRVRSLWLYLERHPVYEPQEWDEAAHPQPWLLRAPGIPICSHPWVRDPEYTDVLADLAGDIAPPVLRLPVERPRGSLLEEDPAPSVLLQSRPYQQAIDGLIATCKAENLRTSALEWYRAHPAELGGMGVSVWLQCVLEDLGPRKKRELGIVVVAEEMSDPIFSGNVVVSDVLVEPA